MQPMTFSPACKVSHVGLLNRVVVWISWGGGEGESRLGESWDPRLKNKNESRQLKTFTKQNWIPGQITVYFL